MNDNFYYTKECRMEIFFLHHAKVLTRFPVTEPERLWFITNEITSDVETSGLRRGCWGCKIMGCCSKYSKWPDVSQLKKISTIVIRVTVGMKLILYATVLDQGRLELGPEPLVSSKNIYSKFNKFALLPNLGNVLLPLGNKMQYWSIMGQ